VISIVAVGVPGERLRVACSRADAARRVVEQLLNGGGEAAPRLP
jgi:hypothetical protein